MKEIMPSVDLAEYQLLGVNWMAGNKIGGMNVNGILADEMGLGNTTPQPTSERRPHLIVVPASVLSNWMNEFKKFAPHMNVVKYYGTQNERQEIQEDMRRWLPGSKVKDPLDVVLTTFSYFSSEKGDDRSFLRKFKFDYLVVDEGHTLKNPKGLRYKNLNKFSSTHRLLLTGTPVQNSPKELMSLLCFLMPLFDTKAKSSKRKGEYDDDGDGNDGGERMLEYFVHLEGGGAGSDETAYRKLKQLFAPFVLRRKKDDVLSQIMPPKTRKVELVPMDEATQSTYDSILANHVKSKASIDFVKQKHLFTELRKAANHPLLLRTRHLDEADTDKLAHLLMKYGYFGYEDSLTLKKVTEELEKFSDYDVHCAAVTLIEENPERQPHLEQYTLLVDDLFCSPKFVRLRTLLPELVGKGHRILLFSQWTRVLDLMHNLLESLDMKFMRLDGSTAVNERQEMIDTFTEDSSIPIFLLSTRAGGMGLNLTAADVCILHDLDFNPFNDRQAEDRCHRIGQKKPVTILKMVTRGTVDEAIYSLQERKERMNEAIMDEKGAKKKNDDNEAIVEIMKGAVDQYLKSPKKASAKASSATKSETIKII
ncbi:helicase-like protein [Thalassiosira pseudonana CCMP1335]|uniref:Helicase-like protein n=1 Tax=Thalassiosira pseudonana TaxID=35128 RepID=B8LE15_THAPS|nr:helicase-like protein [Thalassiosira pseudonana CCMP1335]EED86431.1 helicase-like protein [Thalassiosira pseudonana CCMP1335]